jgi:hypothetical protein
MRRFKTHTAGIFFVVYWCLSTVVLWWSYDISSQIKGEHYKQGQALKLVAEMALIITVLTALAWVFTVKSKPDTSPLQAIWGATWRTGMALFSYWAVVFAFMNFSPNPVPLPDSSFISLLGHINSHFFSEAGWLSYLLTVAPIMTLLSGGLYYIHSQISKPL